MKIKKWISLFLCVAVFLAGCAGKQAQSKETTEPTEQQMALQEETEPSIIPEEPAPTEKPKESETRWETTTEPVEVTEAPTQGPAEETKPTEAPTEQTEAPTEATEPENVDTPEANTEPGWGKLQ